MPKPLIVPIQNWPPETTALITFSPTRSVVTRVQFEEPRVDGPIKWSEYGGPSVAIQRPLSIGTDREVRVAVVHIGEALRSPVIQFLDQNKDIDSEANKRNEAIYKARKDHIGPDPKKNPEQHYLFELDGETNPHFLRLPLREQELGNEREYRIHAVMTIGRYAENRLEGRMTASPPPPFQCKRQHVGYLSALLRGVSNLGANPATVGKILEEFAAGSLGFNLPVPDFPPERISEPDSTAIFHLAEFALLCISEEIDVTFWETLLPVTVKMQGLYAARWDRTKFSESIRLTDYGVPDLPLNNTQRLTVDCSHGKVWDRRNPGKAILYYANMLADHY